MIPPCHRGLTLSTDRVGHRQHVEVRHWCRERRDYLAHPRYLGVGQGHPWRAHRSGVLVFFHAEHDDAASSIRQRRHIASECALV